MQTEISSPSQCKFAISLVKNGAFYANIADFSKSPINFTAPLFYFPETGCLVNNVLDDPP